jgi:acetyl-CoA synthetase
MTHLRIRSFEEYKKAYQYSVEQPESFWDEIATQFYWRKKWKTTLNWNFKTPLIEWFKEGELNITENCLDRHLKHHATKTALIWEANNPNEPSIQLSYQELHKKVSRFANVLKKNHIKKGDRICIYMPMIPELMIAVLACARIGAIHSVVFAGFSAQAMADRINDAEAKMVITSDGMYRGAKTIAVKSIVDKALEQCDCIHHVLVVKRTKQAVNMLKDRDLWVHEELLLVKDDCEAVSMNAEDVLFVLYTSGSTGKPKGVVHTCGGYMVGTAYTFSNVFQYEEEDVYWCTADIGWITGHSYIIYGPLLNGATTVMFEGTPTTPHPGRCWEIIDKYKVNQFYTAPTAIRSLMALGNEHVEKYDLSSLKTIGTVGEPINEEAWQWYYKEVGRERCPIVDTWWQTETGGIMISGLGDLSPQRPTYAGYPLPGIQAVLLDQKGAVITGNEKEGYLAIRFPWPSMLRTTYGDHERCRLTYFSHSENHYFTGDGARRDENGMYRIIGRVDDVINVSGHRFGTAEIENAINTNAHVVESAVVGYPHAIKGQAIYAFVICKSSAAQNDETADSICNTVASQIGKIARPEKIVLVSGLPKTRSGKIMRRILRKIAEQETEQLGDISTLVDPTVVQEIMMKAEIANQVNP